MITECVWDIWGPKPLVVMVNVISGLLEYVAGKASTYRAIQPIDFSSRLVISSA